MDVSWTLAPHTDDSGLPHRTMERVQLPLVSYSALLRLEKTINTGAGGHPASLVCFHGVGLLSSAALQL